MPDQISIQNALILNDLAKLSIEQRVEYYNDVCKSLGLNPLTRPFEFTTLNGKLQLYAKKDATEQLRRIYNVSVTDLKHDHRKELELYVVTAVGQNGQGRADASTGAVSIKGLQGENMANAIMKAETKAKRRLTLSLCGLGILDETELETAQPERIASIVDGQVVIDPETSKSLVENPPAPTKRGRPKKSESVQAPNVPNLPATSKATDFNFGQNVPDQAPPVPEPPSSIPPSSAAPPNIHGVQITDQDLPDNIGPATKEQLAVIGPTVKKLVPEGKMSRLGDYVKKTYNVEKSTDLSKARWDEVIADLQAGKLTEIFT